MSWCNFVVTKSNLLGKSKFFMHFLHWIIASWRTRKGEGCMMIIFASMIKFNNQILYSSLGSDLVRDLDIVIYAQAKYFSFAYHLGKG